MYIAYECIIYLDVRDTSSYSNDMRHASCMPYIRDMTHVCHITAYTSKYVRDTSRYLNDMRHDSCMPYIRDMTHVCHNRIYLEV